MPEIPLPHVVGAFCGPRRVPKCSPSSTNCAPIRHHLLARSADGSIMACLRISSSSFFFINKRPRCARPAERPKMQPVVNILRVHTAPSACPICLRIDHGLPPHLFVFFLFLLIKGRAARGPRRVPKSSPSSTYCAPIRHLLRPAARPKMQPVVDILRAHTAPSACPIC